MTPSSQPKEDMTALAACPFCGNRLQAKRGKINPYARCVMPDCFGAKMPVVSLDVPKDVAAWNTRASTPAAGIRDALESAADWCQMEGDRLGAIDGYDYHSGEEYGLRCAQIELRKRARALASNPLAGRDEA